MSGLDGLRKVAEQATPGPWDTVLHEGSHGGQEWWEVEHVADLHASVSEEENAAHIATFDPVLVLALLDVAEAAEAALPELVDADDPAVVPVANLSEPERRLRKALRRLREVTP